MSVDKTNIRLIRKQRIRKKVKGNELRPRLNVFKSNKHIYAQIVDDTKGVTLVSVSTLNKELKNELKSKKNILAAKKIGEIIAVKAIEKKIDKVCFDRGGFPYHGRIKALVESARQAGLKF